jgi:hypothetical protein
MDSTEASECYRGELATIVNAEVPVARVRGRTERARASEDHRHGPLHRSEDVGK